MSIGEWFLVGVVVGCFCVLAVFPGVVLGSAVMLCLLDEAELGWLHDRSHKNGDVIVVRVVVGLLCAVAVGCVERALYTGNLWWLFGSSNVIPAVIIVEYALWDARQEFARLSRGRLVRC